MNFLRNFELYSGAPSPQYSTAHGEAVAVPVGPSFAPPRPIEEQTEPVDFSTANEPVNFSGGPGIRPVPGFPPPGVHAAYSRESTPDSGGSHYMDAYRDTTGKLITAFLTITQFIGIYWVKPLLNQKIFIFIYLKKFTIFENMVNLSGSRNAYITGAGVITLAKCNIKRGRIIIKS